MICRHCAAPLSRRFLDLGAAPPSNAYLDAADLDRPERHYPLRVMVCDECWLAQTEDFADAADLFTRDYGYFSATSRSWVAHCARFVDAAIERFGLGPDSMVVEVAANDGYLLQSVAARGVPCLGVEPTAGTAAAARARGLEIVETFFGEEVGRALAAEGRAADLTVANNVLAHVPDIGDFVRGFAALLKPAGVAVFEFPHLQRMIEGLQFDTVYHEHFSYLSLTAVDAVFRANGLRVFDIEELSTHGGSLRVYACRADAPPGTPALAPSAAPAATLAAEAAAGVASPAFYDGFQRRAEAVKNDFLRYLLDCRAAGLKVAAYGAAAKGNTLLNFAGVRPDLIAFVADRSPGKLGRWLPGSRIPIVDESRLRSDRPDRIVILPWNLRDELCAQLGDARDWGARFVVAIPALEEF